jgi:hypothetical protein
MLLILAGISSFSCPRLVAALSSPCDAACGGLHAAGALDCCPEFSHHQRYRGKKLITVASFSFQPTEICKNIAYTTSAPPLGPTVLRAQTLPVHRFLRRLRGAAGVWATTARLSSFFAAFLVHLLPRLGPCHRLPAVSGAGLAVFLS